MKYSVAILAFLGAVMSTNAVCITNELSSPYAWSSDCLSELHEVIGAIQGDDVPLSGTMLLAPVGLSERGEVSLRRFTPLPPLPTNSPPPPQLAAILLGSDEDTSFPGIYAASSSGSIIATPSTSLEAVGAAPMTFKNLVYVIEKTGDSTKHPDKSVVISALENIAKFTRRTSTPATLTVVIIGDVDAEEVKDDALFGIENLLGDSAYGTSDSCRLSDIFDLSATKVVKYKDLNPSEKEPATEFMARTKKTLALTRAFTRHVSTGVKLTTPPDAEEEVKKT